MNTAMNKIFRICLALGCLAGIPALSAAQDGRKTCIDQGWKFHYGAAREAISPDFNDMSWRTLDLPHDWSVETEAAAQAGENIGPFSKNNPGGSATGQTVGGEGWYRKTFTLSAADEDKRISLYFEGVYAQSEVWVNCIKVYFNPYGYSSYRFDITDYCKPAGEENTVTVRAVNEGRNTRWYAGSGIYRHVWLMKTPEVYLDAVGDDLGATMGNIINASYKLMVQIQPDAVLVLGDTNSCLSVIGAKRLHIPIFHMEAGNRCKDECLPEETNRRIVDIISDVNMAYSEHARRYLAECGLPKERTYVTGSPMAEVLHANLVEIEKSDIHKRLGLQKGKYILLSAHREENIDTEKNFTSLFNAINMLAAKYDMPILYSCHPRSRKRLETSGFKLDTRVIRHEPLGFHDYNCLQINAFAVVSDSGTLPEESSFFTSVGHPFPAICIRTSTERPEALDKACFVLAGIDEKSLLQAVETAVELHRNGDYGTPVPDYTDENVSTKVVKLIQSYTGVVNKMVWKK